MKKLLLALFALITLSTGKMMAQYTVTTLLSSLSNPVAFDFTPNYDRIFLTQKGGVSGMAVDAQIKVYNISGTYIGIFYDLTDSVNSDFERGLLGIALDPDFTNNHYVYVYYNHLYGGDERIRIIRLTENNNVGSNPTIIFDLDVSESIAGNHVGGNLHFRPSDPNSIYFTIGDLAYQQTNQSLNYAQMLNKPFGKFLRISKTGMNVIPTDNPFYDDGDPNVGNCDYIWTYGHRNAFDFCFSPVSDSLYSSENGLNTWDETNMIHKGRNYGWNTCEGNYLNGSTTTPCSISNSVLPIEDWGAPLPAVTGILYYTGQVMPEFDNHLLVADNDYARIYDITLGNAPVYDQFVSRTTWQDLTGGFTTLREGSEGCVYVMEGGYTTNGKIKKICPQGLTIAENGSLFGNILVSPNPCSTECKVSYTLPKAMHMTAALYDITGRKMADLLDAEQGSGAQSIHIDAAGMGLTPGAYFCRLQTEGSMQTVKLVITK